MTSKTKEIGGWENRVTTGAAWRSFSPDIDGFGQGEEEGSKFRTRLVGSG